MRDDAKAPEAEERGTAPEYLMSLLEQHHAVKQDLAVRASVLLAIDIAVATTVLTLWITIFHERIGAGTIVLIPIVVSMALSGFQAASVILPAQDPSIKLNLNRPDFGQINKALVELRTQIQSDLSELRSAFTVVYLGLSASAFPYLVGLLSISYGGRSWLISRSDVQTTSAILLAIVATPTIVLIFYYAKGDRWMYAFRILTKAAGSIMEHPLELAAFDASSDAVTSQDKAKMSVADVPRIVEDLKSGAVFGITFVIGYLGSIVWVYIFGAFLFILDHQLAGWPPAIWIIAGDALVFGVGIAALYRAVLKLIDRNRLKVVGTAAIIIVLMVCIVLIGRLARLH